MHAYMYDTVNTYTHTPLTGDEDIDFKKFLILITSVKQFLETAQGVCQFACMETISSLYVY